MSLIDLSVLLTLACLVCLIAGLSSILGLGGGVFYVPLFLFLGDFSMKEAAPLSLVIIFGVSIISTLNHYEEHRVAPKTGLMLEMFTLMGATVGTFVNVYLPEAILRFWFGLVLLLFGGWSIWKVRKGRSSTASLTTPGSLTNLPIRRKIMVFSLAILSGIVAGALGIGGGVIKVPLLVYTVGMPMTVAAGTSSLMIMVTSSVTGFLYYLHGQLQVEHAFIFLFSGMVGAYIGTKISTRRLGSQQLNTIFACVLVLVGLVMLFGIPSLVA